MDLLLFPEKNFVIMKRNKNFHISSLVSSNTKSKKKEKNISENFTDENDIKTPTYESLDEPTLPSN